MTDPDKGIRKAQMMATMSQLIAKTAPRCVRPDMRTQYGLPHGTPAQAYPDPELDELQARWERAKAAEDQHAVPVVAVILVDGLAGKYRAVWGTQSLDVWPTVTRDESVHGLDIQTLVDPPCTGLVFTRLMAPPGSIGLLCDTFYTWEDAVAEMFTNAGVVGPDVGELLTQAVDALQESLVLGEDAYPALVALDQDIADLAADREEKAGA